MQFQNIRMIRAGIIGATGFAGIELAALVDEHPFFSLEALASTSGVGQKLESYCPNLKETLAQRELVSIDALLGLGLDIVFLAVPHTTALEMVATLLEQGTRVVDLSADYRLKDAELYHEVYGTQHTHPELLSQAVYGLSEVFRADIAGARLLSNPGCYPTAVTLACLPAVKTGLNNSAVSIMVSAVSGYSGAGRGACESHHYAPSDQNIFPYKPLVHQHAPEIMQTLSSSCAANLVNISFVPQMASFSRGILANCFLTLEESVTQDDVAQVMDSFYESEPFVHVLPAGTFPDVAQISGTNHVFIGWQYDEKSHVLYVASTLDNLMKGAAGQAVQNANIMFGLSETEGLLKHSEVV